MVLKRLSFILLIVSLVAGAALWGHPAPLLAQDGESIPVPTGRLLIGDDSGLSAILADGSEKTVLVEESEPGCWLRDGAWSPDQQWVIYTRICGGGAPTDWHAPNRTATVHLYDIASETASELIPNDGTYQDYVGGWSPDGETVIFYSNRAGEHYNLFLYDFASGETTQITDFQDDIGRVTFDPTGRYLLYNRYVITASEVRWEVRALDLTTETETRVGVGMTPRWSPDGQWIAYTTEGETADVFVMPATCILENTECNPTSNARNITQTPGVLEREPLWSPDQTQIAYLRDTNPEVATTTWDIYRQELRTGLLQRVTNTGDVSERHTDWEQVDVERATIADELPVIVRIIAREGTVNLRETPSTNGDIIGVVSFGQLMYVQGANAARDWYHITLPEDGAQAWVFASLTEPVQGDPARVPQVDE